MERVRNSVLPFIKNLLQTNDSRCCAICHPGFGGSSPAICTQERKQLFFSPFHMTPTGRFLFCVLLPEIFPAKQSGNNFHVNEGIMQGVQLFRLALSWDVSIAHFSHPTDRNRLGTRAYVRPPEIKGPFTSRGKN